MLTLITKSQKAQQFFTEQITVNYQKHGNEIYIPGRFVNELAEAIEDNELIEGTDFEIEK